MGFGSLSSAQQILVKLYLLGGPKYREEMVKAGLATKGLTGANTALGRALEKTNKRSFLQNQLMFTARRAMFYTTLGAVGLTAEVVKMGFAYDNAMQSANVALSQVIKPQRVSEQRASTVVRYRGSYTFPGERRDSGFPPDVHFIQAVPRQHENAEQHDYGDYG